MSPQLAGISLTQPVRSPPCAFANGRQVTAFETPDRPYRKRRPPRMGVTLWTNRRPQKGETLEDRIHAAGSGGIERPIP